MGMLTGQPRTATVVAKTDVTCYRLGKEDFRDILHSRPEIAEDLAHTLARRRLELDTIKGELTEAQHVRMAQTHGDLVSRIRNFFGLEDKA